MITIVLDAGHGQYSNQSPNNKSYYEGTQMFKLSLRLKAELEKFGIKVLLTRNNITENPSLYQRGYLAGKNKADMFISLHSNAPGKNDASITGTVIFYSLTKPELKTVCDKLGQAISKLMEHHFRGSQTKSLPNDSKSDYYGVIRNSVQTGCKNAILIEHGFHTNIKDSNFLLVDSNLQKLAEKEAEIIADYFGLIKKKEIKEPIVSENNDVFVKGEVVKFTGGNHYSSANATKPSKTVEASLAKITNIYNGKHPYHLIKCDKDGNTQSGGVYGWVDVKDIVKLKEDKIELSDEVMLVSGAVYYDTTKAVPSWLYDKTLYVRGINKDRVVVSTQKTGAITGAVNIKFLKKK